MESLAEYSIRTFSNTSVGSRFSPLFCHPSLVPRHQAKAAPYEKFVSSTSWCGRTTGCHSTPLPCSAWKRVTKYHPPMQRANARPLQVCEECDVVVGVYTLSHIVVFVCTTQLLKQGMVCLLFPSQICVLIPSSPSPPPKKLFCLPLIGTWYVE